MPIAPINSFNTRPQRRAKFNVVNATGYGALGFSTASVLAATSKKIKVHKYLAYIGGALAFIHAGVILGHKFSAHKGR